MEREVTLKIVVALILECIFMFGLFYYTYQKVPMPLDVYMALSIIIFIISIPLDIYLYSIGFIYAWPTLNVNFLGNSMSFLSRIFGFTYSHHRLIKKRRVMNQDNS